CVRVAFSATLSGGFDFW
nr:immunoglobulin heavy chain junction region [Macaca mulatta]MOX02362.1 immunoglobulin heavy chain junction region [Macaca mulatta]MOX05706.1 immunoglobulin heavy chain junction region [Macaca mulatta]